MFGSQTRTKVLGYLADSHLPKTAYSLAKETGGSMTRVYGLMKQLARSGIVESRSDESGYTRYVLADDDLRKFLQRRVRVTSSDEWFSPYRAMERRRTYERLKGSKIELPELTPSPSRAPGREEAERRREKDRALQAIREGRPLT
ncbi:MAG: helix-turn-helix domain-containing protein [Candidatus Geothermarchaeales archaeon]